MEILDLSALALACKSLSEAGAGQQKSEFYCWLILTAKNVW